MILSLQNVRKNFNGRSVLDGINLNVQKGELIAVIGPSGCGKSTLLRCINGLETVDSGEIRVEEVKLTSPAALGAPKFRERAQQIRQRVGMVFQSFNLFPHLTVLENVMKAPVVVQKIRKSEAETQARKLLVKVGLSEHCEHYPDELSGGQQQRAAISRALAMSPAVLLYDEPTSALDPMLVDEVFQVMAQLKREGITQIVVTHEMRFARKMADRIVYIEKGQIVEMGTPSEIFEGSIRPQTQQFLRHHL